MAAPDSLGGLAVLSYDEDTSDLFILQVVDASPGTCECGPVTADVPYHARYFEHVRVEDGAVEVDRRFDPESGSLLLDEGAPSVVEGALERRLARTAEEGPSTIVISDGAIRVDLLEKSVEDGRLGCLIDLAVGSTDCR